MASRTGQGGGLAAGIRISRYGAPSEAADKAWSLLLETLYNSGGGYGDPWRYRPSLSISYPDYDIAKVRKATELLLSCKGFAKISPYRRDLVDLTKTWVGGIADLYLATALGSFEDDKPKYRLYKAKFLETLGDLDRIMATRPEHRLSTWITQAKSWGGTETEKRALEQNARMQVTVWGGPVLYDYANKEWAGLNQDFIRRRWELMFSALENSPPNAFKGPTSRSGN